jgi:hypothetical protein
MSRRFDNKRLFILLAGLIIILLLTIVIRIPKENATLKSKIVDLDSVEVCKIILYPKLGSDNPVEFNRNNGKWTVQQGSIISATQKGAVQEIFNEVLRIKPQSLAAKSKVKWKEFELTDSLATRIKFMSKNGKTLSDLMIGKLNYKQINTPGGEYGANNIQATSFVRLYGEKEVYGVEGFIAFLFNGKFDDWRDKTFIQLNEKDITNIMFTYPSDSSYKLIKKDLVWYSDIQIADSSSVADFLKSISNLNGQEIKDNYKPVQNPSYQLLVEGNNLLNFTVKCYMENGTDGYILNSSLNPDVFFADKNDGIFDKLFKPQNYFTKKKTKQK